MKTSKETCTYMYKGGKATTGVTPQRNSVTRSKSAVSGTVDADFWAAVESDGMKMLHSISPLKSNTETSGQPRWKKRKRNRRKRRSRSVTTPCRDTQLVEGHGEAGLQEHGQVNSQKKRTKRKLHSAFSNYLGENDKDTSCELEKSTKEPAPRAPRSETVRVNETSKLAKHKTANVSKDQQGLRENDPQNTCKQKRQTMVTSENQDGNISTSNVQMALKESLNSCWQSENKSSCKNARRATVTSARQSKSLRFKRAKSRIDIFEAKRRKHILEKRRRMGSTKEIEQKTSPTKMCKHDAIQSRTPTQEVLMRLRKEYLSASQPITSAATPVDKQLQLSGSLRRASWARRSRVKALITKFEESVKRRSQCKQERLSRAKHQNASQELVTNVDVSQKIGLGGSQNETALELNPAELLSSEPAHKKLRCSGEEMNESDVNSSSMRNGIETLTVKRSCCRYKHATPSTASKAIQVSPLALELMAVEQNSSALSKSQDLKEQSAQTECHETRKACQTAEVPPYVVNQCDEIMSPEKHSEDSNPEIPFRSNHRSQLDINICQTLHIRKYTSLLRRSMSKEKEMQSSSSKSGDMTDSDSRHSLDTTSSCVLLSPTLSPVAKITCTSSWGPVKFTPKSRRHLDNLRHVSSEERLFSSEDETDNGVKGARRALKEFLCKTEDDNHKAWNVDRDGSDLDSSINVTGQDSDKESQNGSIGGKDNIKDANKNDIICDSDREFTGSDTDCERDRNKVAHSSNSVKFNDKEHVSREVDNSDSVIDKHHDKNDSHNITDSDDDPDNCQNYQSNDIDINALLNDEELSDNGNNDLVAGNSGDVDGELDWQVNDQSGNNNGSGMDSGMSESGKVNRKHGHQNDQVIDTDDDSTSSEERASGNDACNFAEVATNSKRATNKVQINKGHLAKVKPRKTCKRNGGLSTRLLNKQNDDKDETKLEDMSKTSNSKKTSSKTGKRPRNPEIMSIIETKERIAKRVDFNRAVCQSMISPFPEEWEDPLMERVRRDYDSFLQRHFRKLLTELGKKRRLSDKSIERGPTIKEAATARKLERISAKKLTEKVKADGWIDYEILPQIYMEPNTKTFIRKIK